MPSNDPAQRLHDILKSILAINKFVAGLTKEQFADDEKLSAVEYKLLIVSEAARKLGDEAEKLCPGMPWRNIRGLGNWLRHQYGDINADQIWAIVQEDLPPLKAAVEAALASSEATEP